MNHNLMLWETMLQFIKKFNIELPFHLANPLWAHAQKNQKQDLEDLKTYPCILFLIDKIRKIQAPQTDEQIGKIQYVHTTLQS